MTLLSEAPVLARRPEYERAEISHNTITAHRLRLMAGIVLRYCERDVSAKDLPEVNYDFLTGLVSDHRDAPSQQGAMLTAFASRGYSILSCTPAFFKRASNRNVVQPLLAMGLQQAPTHVQAAIMEGTPLEAATEMLAADYAVFAGRGTSCSVFVGDMHYDLRALAAGDSPAEEIYHAAFDVVHAVRRQMH